MIEIETSFIISSSYTMEVRIQNNQHVFSFFVTYVMVRLEFVFNKNVTNTGDHQVYLFPQLIHHYQTFSFSNSIKIKNNLFLFHIKHFKIYVIYLNGRPERETEILHPSEVSIKYSAEENMGKQLLNGNLIFGNIILNIIFIFLKFSKFHIGLSITIYLQHDTNKSYIFKFKRKVILVGEFSCII